MRPKTRNWKSRKIVGRRYGKLCTVPMDFLRSFRTDFGQYLVSIGNFGRSEHQAISCILAEISSLIRNKQKMCPKSWKESFQKWSGEGLKTLHGPSGLLTNPPDRFRAIFSRLRQIRLVWCLKQLFLKSQSKWSCWLLDVPSDRNYRCGPNIAQNRSESFVGRLEGPCKAFQSFSQPFLATFNFGVSGAFLLLFDHSRDLS